jgi:apolipoprotein D and lipocalin family protein
MTLRTLVSAFSAVAALAVLARPAVAAPNFPRNIQSDLKLNYAPPCSICHVHGQTGDGTPIEPFAWSMRGRGLTGSRGTLTSALMADEADNVDSDGDGVSDIDELRKGTDVNSPANDCIIPSGTAIDDGQCSPGVQPSPSLGCHLGHDGDLQGALWVLGLAGSLGWARRRRSANGRHLTRLVVALAAGSVLGCGSATAPLDVASNVDLSRFQGKWYEIARLPRSTESNCNGTTVFYSQAPDGSLSLVNQCNLATPTGPLYTVAMTATVPDRAVPAKLGLQVAGFTGDYWILEVGSNYEYAVVGHPSRLYWWLLSRTPSLDEPTTQAILGRATSEGFDMSPLEYTPQPPAGERNALTTPEGPVPAPLSTGCTMSSTRATARQGVAAWCAFLGAAGLALQRLRTRRSRRRSG